ncbi:MAG: hypothetical protein J4478_02390 [Candidatus Diapherotrites archaeon]|uniref:Uncharacterized protein n=1 Tax=Candidatus Iainarchaeum sp. TaxID=3101447 RepID=A0A8T4KT03_9ARCH|nr:hypothetical protein [Candidatus Diapherotrites archaeon]
MGKIKALLGILIILILGVAVYYIYYLPKQPEIDQQADLGLEEIQNTWQSQGLNVAFLHESPTETLTLSVEELSEIKAKLSELSSSNNEKTRNLAEVYLNYVEFLIKNKQFENASQTVGDDFCNSISGYSSMIALKESAHEALVELNDKILEFNKKYPAESLEINLFTSKDTELLDAEKVQALKANFEDLKKACAGVAS